LAMMAVTMVQCQIQLDALIEEQRVPLVSRAH